MLHNMSEHWIDRAWKDVLKGDPDDAISFFVPSLAAARDYSETLEAADPVHPAIMKKTKIYRCACFNRGIGRATNINFRSPRSLSTRETRNRSIHIPESGMERR